MKKLFALLVVCVLLFTACTTDHDQHDIEHFVKTALQIRNFKVSPDVISRLLYDFLLPYMGLVKSLFLSAGFGVLVYFSLIAIFNISDSREVLKNAKKRLKSRK